MMAAFKVARALEEMDRIKINYRGEKRAYAKMYMYRCRYAEKVGNKTKQNEEYLNWVASYLCRKGG